MLTLSSILHARPMLVLRFGHCEISVCPLTADAFATVACVQSSDAFTGFGMASRQYSFLVASLVVHPIP